MLKDILLFLIVVVVLGFIIYQSIMIVKEFKVLKEQKSRNKKGE